MWPHDLDIGGGAPRIQAGVGAAPATQKNYRNIAGHFRAEHGDKPVAQMQSRHVRRIIAARAATPNAANTLLKVIKMMMRFAVDDGWIEHDPAQEVRKIRAHSDGFHNWTEEEIETFESHWPIGSRTRLAFALLLYTAKRRSDVVRMGRQHVIDEFVAVMQQKGKMRIEVPIHTKLRTILDATPNDHLTFLDTAAGAPFTAAGFGNYLRECCDQAVVPAHCIAHGLRKAGSRPLAEAGCTAHQIKAITGHETVERHTKAVDQKRLAASAMVKLEKPDS